MLMVGCQIVSTEHNFSPRNKALWARDLFNRVPHDLHNDKIALWKKKNLNEFDRWAYDFVKQGDDNTRKRVSWKSKCYND